MRESIHLLDKHTGGEYQIWSRDNFKAIFFNSSSSGIHVGHRDMLIKNICRFDLFYLAWLFVLHFRHTEIICNGLFLHTFFSVWIVANCRNKEEQLTKVRWESGRIRSLQSVFFFFYTRNFKVISSMCSWIMWDDCHLFPVFFLMLMYLSWSVSSLVCLTALGEWNCMIKPYVSLCIHVFVSYFLSCLLSYVTFLFLFFK